jgi:deoxyribodipyrimidine photo-lyase
MNTTRIRTLNKQPYQTGSIIYWMVRDHRVVDNWALYYAQHLAKKFQQPLTVVFSLRSDLRAHQGTARMLEFMLGGLQEVEEELQNLNIPFYFLLTDTQPQQAVQSFIEQHNVGAVVTDFSPLVEQLAWKQQLADAVTIPVFEVDTHNIIPCWLASPNQEFAARTFRPKVHRQLPIYLDVLPQIEKQNSAASFTHQTNDWKKIRATVQVDENIAAVDWLQPGTTAGYERMEVFFTQSTDYAEARNDPNANALSNLSPYLHFGHISAQRVAMSAQKKMSAADRDSFLEELIVRRELADNFCFYNQAYKTVEAFPNWAAQSLAAHQLDPRQYTYSLAELEHAQTHEELWNACQLELVKKGKMHGYMRMYWAKKILEWTANPSQALEYAICLNDRYSLDGRDPNGYVGILWSIGGVHDRPWFEREIFGTVRYMNANGAKRKFDTAKYIQTWTATK